MSYAAEQEGAIWRLIRKDDEDSDMPEEVVTSFQGILCKRDLPPFTEKTMWVVNQKLWPLQLEGPHWIVLQLKPSFVMHTDQARKSSTSGRVPQSRPSVTPFTTILSRISPSYTLYSEGQWAIVSPKKASIPCSKNGQPSMLRIDTSLRKQQHAWRIFDQLEST